MCIRAQAVLCAMIPVTEERTVVEEVMLFTKDIRRAIDDGAHESELLEIAIAVGWKHCRLRSGQAGAGCYYNRRAAPYRLQRGERGVI